MKVKSFSKRFISFFIALVMALTSALAIPLTASAVSSPQACESYNVAIWADAENTITMDDINAFVGGTKTTMVGAVALFRVASSGNYYLFLPSNADCNNLKIWYSTAFSSVSIDNNVIQNGEPTNLLADVDEGGVAKTHTFKVTTTGGTSTSYNTTVMKSGNIGTVYIDTKSGSIKTINSSEHTTSENGTIMVVNPDGTIEYDGVMEKMSGRGNGTWNSSGQKNPYNVKLATSTSLLGMPKAKKWVLLANSGDPSLVKNWITYDFSKYIGVKYQPICKPVDLYVNQQYYGSYNLSEKVEIKSNRIGISDAYESLEIANGTVDEATGAIIPADVSNAEVKAYTSAGSQTTGTTNTFGSLVGNRRYSPSLTDPSDSTGGYLYELEISNRWANDGAGLCAYNRQGWVLKSCDTASKEMVNYSYDLLYAMGSAVYNNGVVPSSATTTRCSSNFYASTTSNPAPAEKYRGMKWNEILDADSAVKYYWTQEYFMNMDASTSSTYFYKESDAIDSKVYAGPVWDMDNALCYDKSGSRWGHSYTSAQDWYAKNARIYRFYATDKSTDYSSDAKSPLNFYAALATNCSDFWTQACSEWYSLIKPATDVLLGNKVDPKGILHSTDYYLNTVAKSGLMDAYRNKGTTSYDANDITTQINQWLTKRNDWLDSQITKVDISSASIEQIPDQACTGSPIEPKLNVTSNGATLVEGKDYTVEYSNNITVSQIAKATITGQGYYTGTKSVYFNIVQGSIDNVKINSIAYAGDTLKSTVTTATGDTLSRYCTYQWYANDVAISGATEATYTIDEAYQNANIKLVVKGDGYNFAQTGITSNECVVKSGTRPDGFTKTLASWDYDYSVNADALTNGDETGETYYYNATSGERAQGAKLIASVNADDIAKIKWSGADLYENSKTSLGTDQAPVMGTSKTDLLGWGYYPYFETVVDTTSFEDIKFSAKLGGSKRGPKEWNLQYSTNGTDYFDIPNTSYSITENKVLEDAYIDAILPDECNDVETLHIRITVNEDIAINGVNTIVNQLSGDAAINNVTVKGASTDVVTELSAPEITTTSLTGDGTMLFSTENIVINDTNGGADVYYTVNGGGAIKYEGEFNPFASTTASSATISAYAKFEDVESDRTVITVTNGGISIGEFNYDGYSQAILNGTVYSTGGAYGESTKMTSVTDGRSQYVPCWNNDNGAFALSPDDGAMWSADSGFYFEASTAGYENICFTAKAYTTARGPKSVKLQYSLDGTSWTDADANNVPLATNSQLEQLFMKAQLPEACDNKSKVYIRIATVENENASGETLHNNESKGNLYINNIVISGNDNGELKMPYSNKATNYFGDKALKYFSADNETMQYAVKDENNNVILSGTYRDGINISAWEGFNFKSAGPYTVSVWEGDADDRSLVNTRKYYYKGDTIVKFNYNDSTKPISSYISNDGTTLTNTTGAKTGSLSMYPNGVSATTLNYSNAYGVKASWASDNMFYSNKALDNPNGNGYWLIQTSTTGYTNVSLSLSQISSNKGPRDWGIAYSTDGTNYTYVENSNARAISNDATLEPIETYNNFALPSACENQDKLYIKLFINGGESVDGAELETLLKGNTGINGIELCGISEPEEYTITFKTVAYEDMNKTIGTTPIESQIYLNGVANQTVNGELTYTVTEGTMFTYYAYVAGNTFASPRVTTYARGNDEIIIPIVALDVTGDGYINAKDYAKIIRDSRYSSNSEYLLGLYPSFHNISQEAFETYQAESQE